MPSAAKVAVITGGGRGIGAATARAAARAGYAVVINYAHSETYANDLVRALRADKHDAIAVQADVSREADVLGLFAAVDRDYGRLDALVNNAGIARQGTAVADIEFERLHAVFATNVFGTFLCAREAVKRMSTARGGRGGAIVNVSSIAAKTAGRPNETVHYGASKAAIDNFTIGLAREVADQGIRVNAVRPGPVQREGGNVQPQAYLDRIATRVPLGRIGMPHEEAAAILWLLSDEASFVTGAVLDVTGGM
jgi:NAD(P)-dependent dehydrogenase (short-subunit alcohol dehydrogenase family)